MPKMDKHEREQKHLSLKYDIFDSSPQRPLRDHASSLASASVDQLILPDADVAFSRKREHTPAKPPHDDGEPGSKRQRAENWPLQETSSGGNETRWYSSPVKPQSASKRNGTPVRPSKFFEASMHDRPSDTPPSVFVRNLSMQIVNASIDDLMDDYANDLESKPLPARPVSRSTVRRSQASSTAHHVRKSVASVAPTIDEQKQSGGAFRFGKSMASAFNPLNVWQKVTTSWRETKEELVHEAKERKEMEERQAKAEETYAALKKSGQLGMQGSRPYSGMAKVFAPGYSNPALDSNQRDSGIAMELDSSRSSMETTKRSSYLAPPSVESSSRKSSISFATRSVSDPKKLLLESANESPRKSFRHLRTPSFHDLRKLPSVVNLHKRSVSAQRPEREGTPNMNELRRSVSKKDLQKQQKLTRRVSDLQAKLDIAKKELESTFNNSLAMDSAESTPRPVLRPRTSNVGTWKRAFTPALPTLLSERLLGGEQTEEQKRKSSEENEMFSAAMSQVQERPKTRSFSGDCLYLQPNEPLTAALELADEVARNENVEVTEQMKQVDEAPLPPPKEHHPEVMELEEPATVKKVAVKNCPSKKNRYSMEDREYKPSVNIIETESDWEPESKARTLEKRRTSAPATNPKSSPKSKKRANMGDQEHKPSTNTAESDSNRDTNPNTLKKRRTNETTTSPNGSPMPKKVTRSSAGASNSPVKKSNVLKKPQPVSKSPPTVSEDGLETVHEENTTTSTVPLKDAPAYSTAHATPAHPSRGFVRGHSRSLSQSPIKSPYKYVSVSAQGLPYTNRDARSMSPAPSSAQSRRGRSSPDNPITVRPGYKEVPPLPTSGREYGVKTEDFEWPDDVF